MEIEQFVSFLIKSELVREQDAQKLAGAFEDACHNSGREASVELFCEFLISTNRLTRWQCEKLQDGKWRGFQMDGYLLLEQIGNDNGYLALMARDTKDSSLVRILVRPYRPEKGIEYRVEPHACQ